jgi:hemolysin III
MDTPVAVRERLQTLGEEIANSISHGIGLLAAVVATPILILTAVHQGRAGFVVGCSIFGASMLLMYVASTLYHALPPGRAKRVFRVLDHGAIYVLIAGSYSPFTLGALGGGWGWGLFGTIWALAAFGIIAKSTGFGWHPRWSSVLYLAMGWLAVVAAKPLWHQLPRASVVWLAVGGVAYTAGVAFYAAPRLRYAHFVWHLFVVAGTTCHVIAVLACAS